MTNYASPIFKKSGERTMTKIVTLKYFLKNYEFLKQLLGIEGKRKKIGGLKYIAL